MKVKIEKLAFGGTGIGELKNGKKVFVKKTVPGDIVDVEITSEKKSFAQGVIKKLISPSDNRIVPNCPYFDHCGGCDHQNISYENQLKYKDEIFQEILSRAKIKVKPEKIIPTTNNEFFYRNSIRFFLIPDDNNQIALHRHKSKTNCNDRFNLSYLSIKKCLLQSERSNQIAKTLVDFINKNIEKKHSFWQLKIREGKRTNEIMIEIITSSDDLPGEKGIIEVLKKIDGVKSIYHTIAPAKSLLNLRRRLIFGSPVIHEKIGSFTFQISPKSFFQTNSFGVKTLYDTIKEFADIKFGDEIIDFYCGTGTIGIYLATLAKKVIGVDCVPEAIRDANDNARINHVKNCQFICSDIIKFKILNLKFHDNSIIVIDPPRAGLPKKLISKLPTSSFKRLIYVSCNPATFARDLKLFKKQGIYAEKIQPIDMFPYTHHIEAVALLKNQV